MHEPLKSLLPLLLLLSIVPYMLIVFLVITVLAFIFAAVGLNAVIQVIPFVVSLAAVVLWLWIARYFLKRRPRSNFALVERCATSYAGGPYKNCIVRH